MAEEKGTRRPDGTFRKVVRVREGYVPADEIPKYQSPGVVGTGPRRIPGMPIPQKVSSIPQRSIPGLPIPQKGSGSAGAQWTRSSATAMTPVSRENKDVDAWDDVPSRLSTAVEKEKDADGGQWARNSAIATIVEKVPVKPPTSSKKEKEKDIDHSSTAGGHIFVKAFAGLGLNDTPDDARADTPELVKEKAKKKLRSLKKTLAKINSLEVKVKNDSTVELNPDQLEMVNKKDALVDEIRRLEESLAD